jgi:hypothetical protein
MKCAEIETDFIAWRSPAAIVEEYGLSDRSSVYRDAHALGLFAKRQRNVRSALERIIEKAGEVEATAASVVAAIQAYSKITSDREQCGSGFAMPNCGLRARATPPASQLPSSPLARGFCDPFT